MNDAGIYAREIPGLDCIVQIGIAGGRVISVSFPEAIPDDANADHPLLDRVEAFVERGPDADIEDAKDFEGVETVEGLETVDMALTVPTDRRSVLEAVRKLPPGEHVPPSRLARLAGLDDGDEADLELVAEALSTNPVPLFVPDHRVDGPGATPADVARRLRAIERSRR